MTHSARDIQIYLSGLADGRDIAQKHPRSSADGIQKHLTSMRLLYERCLEKGVFDMGAERSTSTMRERREAGGLMVQAHPASQTWPAPTQFEKRQKTLSELLRRRDGSAIRLTWWLPLLAFPIAFGAMALYDHAQARVDVETQETDYYVAEEQ